MTYSTVDAKVEAMGAISVRQKDQEIEELWRVLEVYKGLLADLTDKQGKIEEALHFLQECASKVSKSNKMSDQFVTLGNIHQDSQCQSSP